MYAPRHRAALTVLAAGLALAACAPGAQATSAGLPIPPWLEVTLAADRPPEVGRTVLLEATVKALAGPVRDLSLAFSAPEGARVYGKDRAVLSVLRPGETRQYQVRVGLVRPIPAGTFTVEVAAATPHDAIVAQARSTYADRDASMRAEVEARIRRLEATSRFSAFVSFGATAQEGWVAGPGAERYAFDLPGIGPESRFAAAPAVTEPSAKERDRLLERMETLAARLADRPAAAARLAQRLYDLRYAAAVDALAADRLDDADRILAAMGPQPAGMGKTGEVAAANLRAVVLVRRKQFARAAGMWSNALATLGSTPLSRYVHYNVAELHRFLAEPEEAKRHYRQALVMNPGFTLARQRLESLEAE